MIIHKEVTIMDFNKEISEFLCDKVGGITIIDANTSEILCRGTDATEQLMEECPVLQLGAAPVEWEFLDIDSRKYYKCYSAMFEKDSGKYCIHLQTDITEYMSLNRDVTKYMSFFKKLSAFQTAVLEHLSNTYYELLTMLSDYFKADKACFMIQRNDKLDVITYTAEKKLFDNDRIEYDNEIEGIFVSGIEPGDLIDKVPFTLQKIFEANSSLPEQQLCVLCEGNALGQNYAIVFPVSSRLDKESMGERTLINVIKLFVENTMLREKLVYESEHDRLTGLYNKGKYLSMVEKEFPNMNSLAVFNFDVNDLKIMNDTYGHEAGDNLLIKAANSIRKVVNNKIFGFRMGGDEFLMVATNVTVDEVKQLRERWEEELARLNEPDDGIHCVIALGVAYSEAPYDFSELSKQADSLMYEDKKLKKGGREIR